MKKLISIITVFILMFCVYAFATERQTTWNHGVTENGNIQVRIIEKYVKDDKVKFKKISDPMTPPDPKDTSEWDERTQAIVAEITKPEVVAAFETEKKGEILFRKKPYKHISQLTGVGIEEVVSRDCEVLDDNRVAARCIYRLFKDGKEIAKEYHRDWIIPGQVTDAYGVMAMAVARAVHTQAVIDKYYAELKAIGEIK